MIQILINTYNRPNELNSLLFSLDRQKHRLKVAVNDDGSRYSVNFPNYENLELTYQKSRRNKGKVQYWQTCTHLFKMVDKGCNTFIMLPDDATIGDTFIDNAVSQWSAIKDKGIALSLLRMKSTKNGNWGSGKPIRERINGKYYLKTGWIDGCFISGIDLFKRIKYQIEPISLLRWRANKTLGSGVGQQMTKKLRPFGLYHTYKSLVFFLDPHNSVMNENTRKSNPAITI